MCADVYTCTSTCVCVDMCADMSVGMWVDMWVDMCVDMCQPSNRLEPLLYRVLHLAAAGRRKRSVGSAQTAL